MTHHGKAEHFHALHHEGQVLVLPNAWDVASARVAEDAGASAIATTSAGVAWSLGAADGGHLDRDLAVQAVARVAAATELPVTADIENGYASDADGVGETVRRVLEAGAVGVNLEDSDHSGAAPLLPVGDQLPRIAAARRASDAFGVRLYINARVDTYLRGAGDLDETVARAAAYLDAGASGIFVPGVTDPDEVAKLVEAVDAPLNILAGPGAPPVPELAAVGVRRVSLGASIAMAAYARMKDATRELLATGTYAALDEAGKVGRLNKLMRPDG